MIRTNLATRPFYNEGVVRLILLAIAIVAIAATVFNVVRVLQYSRSDTSLALQASRDEARASELHASAARLRGSVDQKQIELASGQARLANELIDRRTFSWTDLFNRFESTLPDDVRITSVRPTIDREGRILLVISLVARGIDDVNLFMERLDGTGAFGNLRPTDERFNDQQLLEATLNTIYTPDAAPSPPVKPAQKGAR